MGKLTVELPESLTRSVESAMLPGHQARAILKITKAFFDDIRGLIAGARTTVARGVDLVQVHTYFEIGRRIVQQEQTREYQLYLPSKAELRRKLIEWTKPRL